MAQVSISYIRQLIRTLSYVVSTHAADELDDDNLEILDLESIILTGQIIERQRDRVTGEAKFRIQGRTRGGELGEAVVKFGLSGKLVVITVYLC